MGGTELARRACSHGDERVGTATQFNVVKGVDSEAGYTTKLVTLMRQLQTLVAPPDKVVRRFWDQLGAVEQERFRAEFPQCMPYIVGGQAAMQYQGSVTASAPL